MSLRGLALATALMHSGCAFVAAAAFNHGRPSNSCMDSPAPGGIDLVIATAGAAAFLATGKAEEQPAYLIIPGVFLMSGLIGSASAYSCRNRKGVGEQPGEPIVYPTIDPTPPDEPSTARDATPEELGISVPGGAPLRIAPTSTPPEPAPGKPDTRIKCSINPLTPCPEDHSCVLVEGEHGYCVRDR